MCLVTSDVRNVIIIGSGPAGWTAAVYAARANLEPLMFEGAVTAGGALMNTTEVENFPGFRDGIMGPDLMENMRAQAERFGTEIVTDDVESVRLEGDVKVVTDSEGTELRASAIMAERALSNPKIRFAWNSAVDAIHGEDKVTGITLRDTVTGVTRDLPVTGLFVAIGHDPRNDLIKGVVELDAEGYVLVEGSSTRTNIPGVFACGDLVDHTYRQAITAAGSGCQASIDAERWLAEQPDNTRDTAPPPTPGVDGAQVDGLASIGAATARSTGGSLG